MTETTTPANLLALTQARALAESKQERDAMTALIHEVLASMGQPVKFYPALGQPWAVVLQILFAEIAARRFTAPYKFDKEGDVNVLCVRQADVFRLLINAPTLESQLPNLTGLSKNTLKRHLDAAAVLVLINGKPLEVERTICKKRVAHMICLNIPALILAGVLDSDPSPIHSLFA